MRKNFTLLIALIAIVATTPLGAKQQQPFEKGKKGQHLSRQIERAPASEIVLSEDFALFTEGTEEQPAEHPICKDGGFTDETQTKVAGWRCNGIYSAGGACAIKTWLYYDEYEQDGSIQTPEMELYGTITVTFRAKKMSGSDDAFIWISLCDNNTGPVDDADIEITDTWQTYTFKSDKGTFNNQNIIQISAIDGYALIDDISIERINNKIETPYTNFVTNNSPTEFTATWDESFGAESYLFNAYYLDKPAADEIVSGSLIENFDNINVNADGKTINSDNPNYPEGWTIEFMPGNTHQVATEKGNYCSQPNALIFSEVDDCIISPKTPQPIKGISFWVKPSAMNEEYDLSMISVMIGRNGEWEPIANIPAMWMEENGGIYSFTYEQIGRNVDQVKIYYIQKGAEALSFMIDDVTLDYETQDVVVPIVSDKEIALTQHTVSNINPDKQHYYYVRAKKGDILSDESYHIPVDGVAGIKLEAQEATNITANGFTANWASLPHAENYNINISRTTIADTDVAGAIVIHETFDKITQGTLDSPGSDWGNPFDLLENGFTDTQWQLTQPQWIEGAAGSSGTSWYGSAGLVVSPRLSLANNGGSFDVEANVYSTSPNDEIFVMILNNITDSQAQYAQSIATTNTNGEFTRKKVHFDQGGANNILIAFMSKSGLAFYVDEVIITQNLKAGEKLSRPYKRISVEQSNSVDITDLPDDNEYSYNITASRELEFTTFISEASDEIIVKMLSGIETAEAVDQINIIGRTGCIDITTTEHKEIEIFDLRGMSLHKIQINNGRYSIAIEAGIYIVKSGNKCTKVIVK